MHQQNIQAVGRRKTAVARVILAPGSGVVTINNSSLLTGGAMAGSQSGIFITGGTVNLDSYTISHINSGLAPVVITTHSDIPGLPSSIHLNIVP